MAGYRSTLSMSKIKVKISEAKFFSFYKTLQAIQPQAVYYRMLQAEYTLRSVSYVK